MNDSFSLFNTAIIWHVLRWNTNVKKFCTGLASTHKIQGSVQVSFHQWDKSQKYIKTFHFCFLASSILEQVHLQYGKVGANYDSLPVH